MVTKQTASSSKRLAKNTILLYLRTLLVMAISLYTSRVILATLGIDNYGIYNVIGGFVSMFSLAGGTLVSATQRFLNFEIGKKEDSNPNKVFCTSMCIHITLSAILLILFETIGLWFLNWKMNIPIDRIYSANWVFQCSVLAFLVNILSIPYNAVIIANEKMSAFAYISLLDVSLKLLVTYLLYLSPWDVLILYAVLLLLESLLIRSIYSIYCSKKFSDITKFYIVKDKAAYKRQVGFAGYTFIGSMAAILSNQGINLIMNIFCGVAVNAARGVAVQVQHAVEKFVTDFMTALNPQITKTYAAGETDKSMQLVYRGAKFSFFLITILAMPIIIRTPYILDLWLKTYPEYAIEFVRLILVYSMLVVLSKPLITEILATGKVKSNAFIIGGLRMLNLPLCYMALNFDYQPTVCFYILILVEIFTMHARLYIIKSYTGNSIIRYYNNVLARILPIIICVLIGDYYINKAIPHSFLGLVIFSSISVSITIVAIAVFGLTNNERSFIMKFVTSKIKK